MQPQYQDYKELINSLKSASTLIGLDSKSQLHQDITAISNYLANPNFQIAVFGLLIMVNLRCSMPY